MVYGNRRLDAYQLFDEMPDYLPVASHGFFLADFHQFHCLRMQIFHLIKEFFLYGFLTKKRLWHVNPKDLNLC